MTHRKQFSHDGTPVSSSVAVQGAASDQLDDAKTNSDEGNYRDGSLEPLLPEIAPEVGEVETTQNDHQDRPQKRMRGHCEVVFGSLVEWSNSKRHIRNSEIQRNCESGHPISASIPPVDESESSVH